MIFVIHLNIANGCTMRGQYYWMRGTARCEDDIGISQCNIEVNLLLGLVMAPGHNGPIFCQFAIIHKRNLMNTLKHLQPQRAIEMGYKDQVSVHAQCTWS